MDHFARLPEDCILEILSFTSARDASRSSLISKGFKSAAESNGVWKRLLPPDYEETISKSVSPVVHVTKKGLYLSLCHSPILIQGGKMSFSLDIRNGKKCFMVGSRELQISWKGCWDFTSHENSRFFEVARLRSIGWIHIQGNIKTRMLSENTTYAAYLVFWHEKLDGLKTSSTVVRLINDQANDTTSGYQHESRETGKIARKRSDGWMEIGMGKFYNGDEDNREAEAWLIEINSPYGKSGLIVEGIEFRPV